MKTHELTIISLHDAQLKCSCSWNFTTTGAMTKAEAMKEYHKHLYQNFAQEWRASHSVSPAPSFTSWKNNYKD